MFNDDSIPNIHWIPVFFFSLLFLQKVKFFMKLIFTFFQRILYIPEMIAHTKMWTTQFTTTTNKILLDEEESEKIKKIRRKLSLFSGTHTRIHSILKGFSMLLLLHFTINKLFVLNGTHNDHLILNLNFFLLNSNFFLNFLLLFKLIKKFKKNY